MVHVIVPGWLFLKPALIKAETFAQIATDLEIIIGAERCTDV